MIYSDVADYGFPLHFQRDFLTEAVMPGRILTKILLTNPPFRDIGPFVARALRLSPLVIMLVRLALNADRAPHFDPGELRARSHPLLPQTSANASTRRLGRPKIE